MTQDLDSNKVRSLLESIRSQPSEMQTQAVGEALAYAFQTIERLEHRIRALEVSHGPESGRAVIDQVGNG
jgi:hypothetical protein